MSNFLKIGKNGNLYLDNTLVTTQGVNDINEHLMHLLGFYITVEEDVRLEEIVHAVFGMKKFISGYFSEDYEVVRAFAASSKLDKKYKAIKFYKSFQVEPDGDMDLEEDYLYVLPEVKFIEASADEVGYDKLGELPVIIDENIILNHDEVELKMKSKFTFLDVLTCVFDEVSNCIQSGTISV